jgi:hypothetical protein
MIRVLGLRWWRPVSTLDEEAAALMVAAHVMRFASRVLGRLRRPQELSVAGLSC